MKRQSMKSLATVAMLILSLSMASAQLYWANDSRNPIMTNGARLIEPCVQYDPVAAHYDMWFCDGNNVRRAVSADGISWQLTGATQNLTALFSTYFCFSVEVVKIGSTYYLYAGCSTSDWVTSIGLATSPDGNVWTKHPSSPAIAPGGINSWEKSYILSPRIVYKDGLYYMYYQGNGTVDEIGLATSQDGVYWTKYSGNPVIGLQNVAQNITALAPAGLTVVDGLFYMIVNQATGTTRVDGYLATSSDGISWTFQGTSPTIPQGNTGTWNGGWLGGGSLHYLQGQFWYWYCATDTKPYQGDQTYRMGLATGSSTPPPEPFWQRTNGPSAGQDVRSFASNSQGELFAGTWTAGEVFRTTDNGDQWTLCGPIPNTNPILGLSIDQHDHIFASVYLRGVARSTDNGTSWQMKSTGLTNLAARGTLVDKQNNVWVATEAGLFRSTNDGESWVNMKPGLFYDVWLDSTNAIVSQAGDGYGNNTIYRSTGSGTSTWTSTTVTNIGLGGIHADGAYYAYTLNAQIFRSTDFGSTWTDTHSPVSWNNSATTQMAFTRSGDIFYVGNDRGVLRSTDNGLSWEIKNDGLVTTHNGSVFYHPDGYVFIGSGGYGVFRSSLTPVPPQDITVSLPNIATAAGTGVEIPVNVTSLSGQGILSYEFTLTCNSPDSVLSFEALPVTAGTLSGANGWSVQVNSTAPNQVKVGAFGAAPLYGKGTLLKLKARTVAGAAAGDSTSLVLSDFLFNAGTPQPSILNGSVTIHERVCGDADENGSVQAYDAALTLREAMGPMPPPPAPLTTMGRINADVNMDGKVQAYDAALILTHVVGLPMPESTATCFGAQGIAGSPTSLSLTGHLDSRQYVGGKWVVQVRLTGVPADLPVISYAFELTTPASWGDNINLTLPQLAQGYLATVNPLGNGQFRVGIINPNGVDVENIPFTLTSNNSSSLNAITFSELFLNNAPNDTITLANIFTSVDPPKPINPQLYELVGAYPNPFNPLTRVVFQTPVSGPVRLEVYNMQGVRIKTLRDEPMASGRHEIFWDGTNSLGQSVATGEYFCLMRAGSFVKTLRLLLLR